MQLLESVSALSGSGAMAWLLIAIPLAGAAFLLLAGKLTDAWGHLLATVAPIVSFVLGLVLFAQLLGSPADARHIDVSVYEWIATGAWSIEFGLLVDPLSILFVLLITGVGSLIHVYSIGYMAHDDRRRRFFAYLNLFIAAMLRPRSPTRLTMNALLPAAAAEGLCAQKEMSRHEARPTPSQPRNSTR